MRLTEKDILLAREGYKTLLTEKKAHSRSGVGRAGKPAGSVREGRKSAPKAGEGKIRLVLKMGNKEVNVPESAVEAFTKVLEQLAKGKDVTVSAKPDEMTTQQAADFLHVSRPFLISLLEKGEIPFHKVGTHRRIRFSDLFSYKEGIDARRLETLEELTRQAQNLDMGY